MTPIFYHASVQRCMFVLASISLFACTAPAPQPAQPPAASDVSAARATTSSPVTDEKKPVESPGKLLALRKDLAASGLAFSATPEGDIKINIPSDTSFSLGRTAVGPTFGRLLNNLADLFNKYPNTAIEIVGHTDTSGTDAFNMVISLKRAESTRDHLVSRKVAADRIKVQGGGSDQPIADNNTPQGRAMNRRVEIFVSER